MALLKTELRELKRDFNVEKEFNNDIQRDIDDREKELE